jgi:hypothetical protein
VPSPDAETLLWHNAHCGYVEAPSFGNWQYKLSAEPLRNRADMAAIIAAYGYEIPPELAPYFNPEPIPKPEGVEGRDWTW